MRRRYRASAGTSSPFLRMLVSGSPSTKIIPSSIRSSVISMRSTVVLPELAILVRNEEMRLGTEINYTAMTEEEFKFRKQRNDPFLVGILSGSRVMIIGDEEGLLA